MRRGRREETKKDKKERRALNREIKSQFTTVVLPTLIVIVLFIVAFIYMKTRPM